MGTSKTVARLRAVREAVGRTGEGEESPEAGFTLIELMVVLLIMGILLAIAIPTFLGVTGSAHAAATKTNISSAMTEADATYTNTSSFAASATAEKTELEAVTKAMTFATGTVSGTSTISVDVFSASGGAASATTSQIVVMASKDTTGVCWYEGDNETSTTPTTGQEVPPGVHYFGKKTTTCEASTAIVAATWGTKYPKVTP